MHELKIYREVLCRYKEEWYQIGAGIVLSVQNWHEKFDKFWPVHSKISKICTLIGFFWTKYIMFDLKKYRGVLFGSTKYWYNIWRKTDLCFQKWHEEFSKFLPEHLRKSRNWDFDGILLSRVENVWQGSFVMTMKNDAKFEEELTCQFKIDMRNLTNFDPSTRKSQKFAL